MVLTVKAGLHTTTPPLCVCSICSPAHGASAEVEYLDATGETALELDEAEDRMHAPFKYAEMRMSLRTVFSYPFFSLKETA